MSSRKAILGLCLAFLITLPAVTTRLYASDEIEYFAWLRSAAFDRDADFQNEYQYFYDAGVSHTAGFHETFLERTTEIGRRVNYATAGAALLWSPFYAIGHAVALATGAPADGFSRPYIAAVACGSAFYAFLAILLSALTAQRLFGHGLGASFAIACGTPLIFYAYVAPGFGHAASAFAVSLFVWVWLRVRDRWSINGAIALGLCGGLLAFVREQDVFLVVGPALDFVRHWVRPSSGSNTRARTMTTQPWVTAIAGTLAFLVALAPLLLSYYAVNGHLGATETAARKMNWAAPHALSVLFSLQYGLFAWTPLAFVAIAGLVVMWRRGAPTLAAGIGMADVRWIGGLLLLMVAAQAYSSGSVESWTVAGSFGQRRFVAITPLLALGLAGLFTHVRATWPRRALVALVGLCIWWNLGLMAQFGMHRMDRQKLTLLDNARVTFLELPVEAPALAWRYFTDRSSFYKLPRQ